MTYIFNIIFCVSIICVGVYHLFHEVVGTLAQMFFCELHESFKNRFFYRTPLVAVSETNC